MQRILPPLQRLCCTAVDRRIESAAAHQLRLLVVRARPRLHTTLMKGSRTVHQAAHHKQRIISSIFTSSMSHAACHKQRIISSIFTSSASHADLSMRVLIRSRLPSVRADAGRH